MLATFAAPVHSGNLFEKPVDVAPPAEVVQEFSTVDAKILSFAEDVAEMAQIDVDNLMEVLLEYANAMSAFQHSPTDEAARRKATENFAEVTSLAFHRDVLPAQSRKLLDLFFWATASGQLIATSKHFQV